jgi:MYXO-CTERM domain-containing protein
MRWGFLLAAMGLSLGPAHGFQILTAASTPCHERLTLGAFGLRGGAFSSDAADRGVFEAMVARAEARGIPNDKVTRSFVKDVRDTYSFAVNTPAEAWVAASIVAGAREPDTRGFAVVAFNELRTTHIGDEFQAPHSLRRAGHDGEEGNALAIADARVHLQGLLRQAHELFWSDEPIVKERWTFAFYGEARVKMFGPAFRMGQMAHTLQDAFTHTLRNENLEIVTVLNFVDASLGRLEEGRDGLNHSDRLDFCDTSNSFDMQRIAGARDATISMLAAVEEAMQGQSLNSTLLEAVLDVSYAYAPGCTVENDYCGTDWLAPARSQLTGPVDLSVCSTRPGRDADGPWWVLVLALGWRWRR